MDLRKSEASDPTMISFDLMFDAALASKHRRSEVRRGKRWKNEICETFSPFSSIHSCTGHQTDNNKMDVDEKTDADCGERVFAGRENSWNVDKVAQSCSSPSSMSV